MDRKIDLKIEKININELIPYINNSKKHPQWQIEQIKSSIAEFGFNDPIAVDQDNVIIEGHGRFEALKQMNFKEVQIIRLKHLSEYQKKAYIIAHNKININTDFDFDILKEELKFLKDSDFDLSSIGFDDEEIETFLEENNDISDIEEVEEFNDNYNIIIVCEGIEEAEKLKKKLSINDLDLTKQVLKVKFKDII